jgi:hypothetical protein
MAIDTMSGPAVMALCGLLILYVLRTVTMYAKLRQFRGPTWTGISNWPHSVAMLRGNCHEWYAEVNKEYGAENLRGTFLCWHLYQDALFSTPS